jgi:hypothetical protein
MTAYESSSFSAGQDCGWNRWRHRLMASALVACAEELESTADADRPRDEKAAGQVWTPVSSPLPLRFA